jgi:predicted short-subunit dehydrogenase-like oxidoreductase (DUF2520 family)
MGGEPVVISEAQRPQFAEAIATASQFSAAIVDQATNLLGEIGIENPGRIVAPLIRSAVDNALGQAGDASRLGFTGLDD